MWNFPLFYTTIHEKLVKSTVANDFLLHLLVVDDDTKYVFRYLSISHSKRTCKKKKIRGKCTCARYAYCNENKENIIENGKTDENVTTRLQFAVSCKDSTYKLCQFIVAGKWIKKYHLSESLHIVSHLENTKNNKISIDISNLAKEDCKIMVRTKKTGFGISIRETDVTKPYIYNC